MIFPLWCLLNIPGYNKQYQVSYKHQKFKKVIFFLFLSNIIKTAEHKKQAVFIF